MKKIIFTTTDIFTVEPNYEARGLRNGHPDVVAWIEDYDNKPGAKAAVLTTHLLERALEQGFDVYVFSTRDRFWEHDTWWRQQIPAQNIVLAGDFKQPGDRSDDAIKRAAHILAHRLGVRWPMLHINTADRIKKVPMHWVPGLHEMAKDHGFLLANDLRG